MAEQTCPTWRDVIRAMRAAGLGLYVDERDKAYRKWLIDDDNANDTGVIARESYGSGAIWTVDLYGKDGWSVSMRNPNPADVLTAANLLSLVGAS